MRKCVAHWTQHYIIVMKRTSTDNPEWNGVAMPRRVWAILAVAFGVSSSVISGAIVNIALPTFCVEMEVSSADSVWLVNSFQLATVMTLLIFSNLGDIIGYRRVYVAGLALFTLASLGCALSTDFPMLVACRTCAGIGAAAVTSVNTTIIRIIYPRNRLARGLGLNATIVAISSVIGPPLAAAVLSFASWHWLFAINIPIGLAALALSCSFLPANPVRAAGRRLDKLDCLLNALTFGLLIFSIEAFSHDVDATVVAVTLTATLVIGWFYVRRQLHKDMPLLPFDLLRIPIFSLSILTSICSFTAQTLAMVSLPFILQHNMGYSAVDTGLVLVAWPMVIMFIAPMAGRRLDKLDCLLNALTFGLLIFSIEAFSHDVDATVVAVTLTATLVIGWFYVRRQLHKDMPLLPFDLLRIPIFSLSILTSICSFTAQTLAMVSLPFILQHNMGYSAVDTGLVLVAWPMVIMFIAPMAGRMVEHIHAGVLGVAGLAMMTAGLLALGLMPERLSTFDIVWRLVLCGAGFGIFQSPNNSIMIASAPAARSGSASGMLATARLLGQSSGAAMVAMLFHLCGGETTALPMFVAAGFAGVGAIVSSSRIRLPLPEGLQRG